MTFFPWAHYGTEVWVDGKSQGPQEELLLSAPLRRLINTSWTGGHTSEGFVDPEEAPAENLASHAGRLDLSSSLLLALYISPLLLFLPYSMSSLFYTFLPLLLLFLKNGLCGG